MNHADKNFYAVAKRNRRLVRAGGWLAAGILFGSVLQAADLRPDNVFAYPPKLSQNLQRVALLPLTAESQAADLPEGCENLQPVLLDELTRTKKFEVVAVNPEILRGGSGRQAWTGAEELPVDFFDTLRREYGCDAVLFSELTVYRAYAPMVIGWRLKLVDARTREIIWAADQVFDAGQPPVAQATWHFWIRRDKASANDENRWASANSPRQFGHYTAAAVFGTLPER